MPFFPLDLGTALVRINSRPVYDHRDQAPRQDAFESVLERLARHVTEVASISHQECAGPKQASGQSGLQLLGPHPAM